MAAVDLLDENEVFLKKSDWPCIVRYSDFERLENTSFSMRISGGRKGRT